MDEIIKQKIAEWAKKETIYEVAICFLAILLVISFMVKHFKALAEAMPSVRKALQYIQRKWFADATFKRDLMDKIGGLERSIGEVKKEVQYNGGSITLSDALKRVESGQTELKTMVSHNKALRDITDLCSDRMIFRVNNTGACIFINDAFLKFFGWQESDVMDYGFEDLVHEDDRSEMRLKWTKAINTKTPFKDEQLIKDCDGKYHSCTVRAFPVVTDEQLREFSGTIDFIK